MQRILGITLTILIVCQGMELSVFIRIEIIIFGWEPPKGWLCSIRNQKCFIHFKEAKGEKIMLYLILGRWMIIGFGLLQNLGELLYWI